MALQPARFSSEELADTVGGEVELTYNRPLHATVHCINKPGAPNVAVYLYSFTQALPSNPKYLT